MTYREQIKECLSKGREHIALAEKSTGLGKRVDERLHYRLACSFLIDAITAYNDVINLMGTTDEDVQEAEAGDTDYDETVGALDGNETPDAPDYN